jgi:hypothetical protein
MVSKVFIEILFGLLYKKGVYAFQIGFNWFLVPRACCLI